MIMTGDKSVLADKSAGHIAKERTASRPLIGAQRRLAARTRVPRTHMIRETYISYLHIIIVSLNHELQQSWAVGKERVINDTQGLRVRQQSWASCLWIGC